MTKVLKTSLAMLLAFVMLIGALPFSVSAATPSMIISVSTKNAMAGQTVDLDVMVKDNPGVAAISLDIDYDKDNLTLTGFTYNTEALVGAQTTPYNESASIPTLYMVNGTANITGDFKLATLTFAVKESAKNNVAAYVRLSYDPDNIYDITETNIDTVIENGAINIIACVPGDINGDEKVNSKDVSRLMQYHAHWNVDVNEPALDTNGDGKLNSKDVTRLMQYIAHYDVEIYPQITTDEDKLTAVAAVAATCQKEGNIAYWINEETGKYYKDAKGLVEITLADTVLEKLDHTPVIDSAVPATYENTGLTEGSHCSVCGEVLIKQEVTPKLSKDEYPITYHLYADDAYLQSVGANNPNPSTYSSQDGLSLKNLRVEGYIFEGWYDGEGANGELVKSIPVGSTGEVELYAKWTAREYTITFNSPLVPVAPKKYYVNTGATWTNPELNGYNFIGWCDENDNLVTRIPIGTTGNITLYANWTSKRNQTRPVSQLDEPIILEDSENGTILFSYEIGTIENVPLQQISDVYQSVGGMKQTFTTYSSATIGDTEAKTVAKTVSNTTSDSKSWSLSSDWNDVTSVSESYASQKGWSKEEAETKSKTSSNTYSINSSSGGSKSLTSSSGLSGTLSSSNSSTSGSSVGVTRETGSEFGVNGKMSVGGEVGGSVGIDEIASVGAKVSGGYEIGASYSNYDKNGASINLSHSNTGTNASTISANNSNASSSSSTWNTSSGYSRSSSTSQSNTVATVLSEVISESKGYGQSYARGGSENNTQAFTKSASESDQYSSAITYSNTTTDSYTKTIELGGSNDGYYRFVLAGTAHVFAVVGYDVSTSSYYEFTYTVMDDKTYTFVDYSKTTASFNDNENGVLPFEVPYFVKEYVDARMLKSEGLSISQEGIVTGYTGDADVVFIPAYYRMDNMDGETYTSIKVRGISPNAFANKNIKAISLSSFIEEIPDNAFSNCSSLEAILCPGVKSIGNEAFKGCTSLNEFTIPWSIETLGNNVFNGVNKISVQASTKEVVYGTLNSGAKQVILNISADPNEMEGVEFTVPDSVDHFELRGNANTYSNIKLISDAKTTVINGLNITCSSGIPLKISSNNIVFNRVNVNSKGFSVLLSNPEAKISLYGSIRLNSESGKAVVCRSIDLSQVDESISSSLSVFGNIYVCGEIKGQPYLQIDSGEIIYISEDEFNNYIRGSYEILFDANGGEVDQSSKTVYYGLKIGDLPTPTRDYYQFKGWYTDIGDSGERITSETIFENNEDINVVAHWLDNDTSEWVLESEAPQNAKIVDDKWTYFQKETKSSSDSSLTDWIRYDKQRTGWGSTQGPVYSDPSNGERNVWSERYVTSSNYKTVYHYYRYAAQREGGYGSYQKTSSYPHYYQLDLDSPLEKTSSIDGHNRYMWWYSSSNWVGMYECSPYTTQEKVSDNYGTRWYYQEPVYTYYYYRYVNKESDNVIEPSENISGVLHWVRYISKTGESTSPLEFDALILNKETQKPIVNSESSNVIVGTENKTAAQVWHFERNLDDGTYLITSCADGKAIDVENYGTENGTNIQVFNNKNNTAQRWYLQQYSGGYNLVPQCSLNGAMDLKDGKTDDNTNVQLYQWNGTSAQIFEIVLIPDLNSYLAK